MINYYKNKPSLHRKSKKDFLSVLVIPYSV